MNMATTTPVTTSAPTPLHMLAHWAETKGNDVYLRQPINGQYQEYTWQQVQQKVHQLAGALRHLGFKAGDKIGILSKNCAEWFIVDLALMHGGYISVPIYPTANADTIDYVLEHSAAKAIFVGKLDYWQGQESGVRNDILRLGMNYDSMPCQYQWQQLLDLAEPLVEAPKPLPEQMMTLIYTSGSTGKPKGAVQTFAAYSWTCQAVVRDLKTTGQDRLISYLPLAHITERVAIQGSSYYSGTPVAFVESLDSFVADVNRCQPTVFFSVPRLWTVFQQNIFAKVGGEQKLSRLLSIPLLNYFVKKKIRKGLGLDQCRLFGSGSAPIPASLLQWYHQIGIPISEAWGMTENCAYSIINYPFDPSKIGSVGKPVEDSLVKLGENNELMVKSPGLMREYYLQPEATAAAFDEEGYFHTGDMASIDSDGTIHIVGRVKDNFKTSKGKYVVPTKIEQKLAYNPNIELTCVIGSGLPHPIALVQLSEAASSQAREDVTESLQATLTEVNGHLESHETLDAMVVVNDPWTIDNEVLTPTLKIKRHVLEERFAQRVDGLRGGAIRWEDELN